MKRFIKYLPLVLLFLSCAKQPEGLEGSEQESFDTISPWPHSDTTHSFWDK